MKELAIIAVCAFALNCADIMLKSSSVFSAPFAAATAIYIATVWPAWYVLHHAQFGHVLWLWAAIAVIIAAMTAVFWYHEPMTLRRWAACGFALLAIGLEK